MIRNTRESYGWLAIALHWLMALAIFGMFGLGLYMVELTYYDAWYKGSLDLHKSVGMVIFVLWLLRLIWRMNNETPDELPGPFWEQLLARLMHVALYAVMLALMISGFLISTADGRSIDVFGLVPVPALPWRVENQEDIAGEIHEWLAWGLMALVSLHAVAAVKHQWLNKDRGLMRMLRVTQKS